MIYVQETTELIQLSYYSTDTPTSLLLKRGRELHSFSDMSIIESMNSYRVVVLARISNIEKHCIARECSKLEDFSAKQGRKQFSQIWSNFGLKKVLFSL